MATHQSALTPISDFFPSSEVATMQQTDSAAYKLKPRSFHKSAYLWVHPVDFHPGVNHAWQYYQTPKSAVASKQFCLLNPLLQFCLQFNLTICISKSKWLSLTITLQLRSHCLGHPSMLFCTSVTRWPIHQMCHNAQDKFTKEAIHLWGLLLVSFNLAKQFCLFLAQVLFLWTTILIGRIFPLILLLTIIQLINLHFLLAHSPNPVGAIILMNNWLKYLANLLTHLILIRLLVLIIMQGELKPTFPTPSAALSLTSSIISCSNAIYISVLIRCNSTWTLRRSTLQWPTSLE